MQKWSCVFFKVPGRKLQEQRARWACEPAMSPRTTKEFRSANTKATRKGIVDPPADAPMSTFCPREMWLPAPHCRHGRGRRSGAPSLGSFEPHASDPYARECLILLKTVDRMPAVRQTNRTFDFGAARLQTSLIAFATEWCAYGQLRK